VVKVGKRRTSFRRRGQAQDDYKRHPHLPSRTALEASNPAIELEKAWRES
jgi:hypothetical protein